MATIKRKLKAEKPLWVVDFDHTLFDSNRFINDLGLRLESKWNIPLATYMKAKHTVQEHDIYTFERHFRAIAQSLNMSLPMLMKEVNAFSKKMANYIYPDAALFLKEAKKRGDIILLSHGNPLHQRKKIKLTGIGKFAKKVIIADTKLEKGEWLKKFAKKSNMIIFVNDDPGETRQIFTIAEPPWKTFLVERPNARYFSIPKDESYMVVRDLTTIFSLL